MTSQHTGTRQPLAFNREAAEVYAVNSAVAVVMVMWSWMALPPGSHTIPEVLWGGAIIVGISWVIAFLVAGLPFQRARPEERPTSQ
jgi:hypothetical protein